MAVAKKRILKERTRNGGTETQAKHMGNIRGVLRRMTRFWKPKKMALDAVCVRSISNGVKVNRYQCKHCQNYYPLKSVEVNHIIPAGSLKSYKDLPDFCERLFVEDINLLEVLCKECHARVTKQQREED
jgi:hypothetical protein